MRPRRLLLVAAVLGALVGPTLPGLAEERVAQSTVVRRTLPAAVATAGGAEVALPTGTTLAGLSWPAGTSTHPTTVDVRWRTPAGWTPWATEDVETRAADDDAGVRPGTEPLWPPTGAVSVGVRIVAGAAAPQLLLVGERTDRRWRAVARGSALAAPSTTGEERLGAVVSRREWGADESIRKPVTYQSRTRAVVVHHTVNDNDYAAADVPAILRSIYAFHVRGRGFDDIAYNLLVDRFGRVFEGRAGGFRTRAIKGSHTGGFNDGTLGVAMIGNLETAAPEPPMVEAVARVSAWAADRWRYDPRSATTLTSKGSSRYAEGRRVTAPRLLGHRDLSATACPGKLAYPLLPDLRERSWRLLAPVITDVVVEGAPVRSPEPLRIRGRLTARAQWRIEVSSPVSGVVTASDGQGDAPSLEWDGRIGGLPALPGEYTWTATADDGVHGPSDPVSGVVLVGPPDLTRGRAGRS